MEYGYMYKITPWRCVVFAALAGVLTWVVLALIQSYVDISALAVLIIGGVVMLLAAMIDLIRVGVFTHDQPVYCSPEPLFPHERRTAIRVLERLVLWNGGGSSDKVWQDAADLLEHLRETDPDEWGGV